MHSCVPPQSSSASTGACFIFEATPNFFRPQPAPSWFRNSVGCFPLHAEHFFGDSQGFRECFDMHQYIFLPSQPSGLPAYFPYWPASMRCPASHRNLDKGYAHSLLSLYNPGSAHEALTQCDCAQRAVAPQIYPSCAPPGVRSKTDGSFLLNGAEGCWLCSLVPCVYCEETAAGG